MVQPVSTLAPGTTACLPSADLKRNSLGAPCDHTDIVRGSSGMFILLWASTSWTGFIVS